MVSGIQDSEAFYNMAKQVGRLRRLLLNNTLCSTRYNVFILKKKWCWRKQPSIRLDSTNNYIRLGSKYMIYEI